MESLIGVLPTIIEICVPILTLLVAWTVRKLAKKLDIENKINIEHLIDMVCKQAIGYVEKLDKNLQKMHNEKLESGDKLAKAIEIVTKELKLLGLTKITSDILVEKIEALLNKEKE